jgi:hypothetical protein
MLTSRKAIFLMVTMVIACVTTALAVISVMTGMPMSKQQTHTAMVSESAICQATAWSSISRQCAEAEADSRHLAEARSIPGNQISQPQTKRPASAP